MSIDKSLRLANSMQRHRSVLSRAERIAKLQDEGKWEEAQSIFGLPKVRVFRAKRRVKAAPKEAEGEAAPETQEAAAETAETKETSKS